MFVQRGQWELPRQYEPSTARIEGPPGSSEDWGMMREVYQTDLTQIVDELIAMAALVPPAITDATTALLECDLGLSEKVISGDAHLDERYRALDARVVDVLARQSPVASDLRLLVATLRMSSSIERMGDLAVHIATVARRRHPECAVPESLRDHIAQMSQLCVNATVRSAEVIANRDLTTAALLAKEDDRIDELSLQIVRSIPRDESLRAQEIVDLTLLSRFYERLGDHAVSVARRVGFLVTGEAYDSLHPAEDVSDF